MVKVIKKYRDIDLFDRNQDYSLDNALEVIKGLPKAKFLESLDISLNLNIDTKKSDQVVRGVVTLPHGIGKNVIVAVFAKDAKAEEARKAGADIVGSDDLVADIQAGKVNMDRCIATPDMMVNVGKVAKILGPRGLMPSPKVGAVTMDIENAVKLAKAGQVQFRADKFGVVHAGLGKLSFDNQAIIENIKAFVNAIKNSKPTTVKGTYIKSAFISTTMGPGIKLQTAELTD